MNSPLTSGNKPSISYDEDGAHIAAQWLWANGLKELTTQAASDGYVEDYEVRIGGRHGRGSDFVAQATRHHWSELVDSDIDDHWEHVAKEREAALNTLFDQQTHGHGALVDHWQDILSSLEQTHSDFDESEFADWTREAHAELAREYGNDHLFDLVPKLVGGCDGMCTLNMRIDQTRYAEDALAIPNFVSANSAPDWVLLLQICNIHPADLANAARARALKTLSDPDIAWGPDEKAEILEQLEAQGMSSFVSKDPLAWKGGLSELAKAYAQTAASLPADISKPFADVDQILDLLDDDSVEFEARFGLGADDLAEHSELIGRFGEKSPLCGENLAALTMLAQSPDIAIGGETLGFSGPFYFLATEATWSGETEYAERCTAACASKRRAASQANASAWSARDAAKQDAPPDAFPRFETQKAELSKQCVELRQWVQEHATPSEAALLAAPAEAPCPPARIEDFKIAAGAMVDAPWRLSSLLELGDSRDSLGNTLAHKAAAMHDSALLELALKSHPKLASDPNMGGLRPIDQIWNFGPQVATFIEMACAILAARPDLAHELSPYGQTFLSVALASKASPEQIGKLLDAGASMDQPSKNGQLPWSLLVHRAPYEIVNSLAPAIARGWNIDSVDSRGQTLGHKTSSIETLQALLRLGSSLSIRDLLGNAPGYLIADKSKLSQFERDQLLETTQSSSVSQKTRSL